MRLAHATGRVDGASQEERVSLRQTAFPSISTGGSQRVACQTTPPPGLGKFMSGSEYEVYRVSQEREHGPLDGPYRPLVYQTIVRSLAFLCIPSWAYTWPLTEAKPLG